MGKKKAETESKTPESLKTLHVITERAGMGNGGHLKIAKEALKAGAKVIQLRDKEMTDSEMGKLGRKMLKMTKTRNALLIINDRTSVAKRIGADGVHLGQKDVPVAAGRKKLKNKIIGASASGINKALKAVKEGADYIGFGPVFKTKSKKDAAKPCRIEGLKKIRMEFERRKIKTPVIAIGGITERNAEQVMKYADGIAVIGAISESRNRKMTIRRLLKIVERKKQTANRD